MATFKKGDRVLCINTEGFTPEGPDDPWAYPQWMGVYTISHVYRDGTVTLIELSLFEANLKFFQEGKLTEAAFYPWHFVKILEIDAVSTLREELQRKNACIVHAKVLLYKNEKL